MGLLYLLAIPLVLAAPGAGALFMRRRRWLALYALGVGLIIMAYFVWLGREIATGRNSDMGETVAIGFGVWLALSLLVGVTIRAAALARSSGARGDRA